ncbi:hypothetical protein H0H93_013218 [Arthromyces matolae]|nr:hypothetical protein H0H93_013218 [Arthromyces matolae]
MLLTKSFVALSILRGAYAASATVGSVANLYISNANISPDGFTRSAVLAGTASSASFPGPLITANKGDKFQLNVIDQLADTTMLTGTSIPFSIGTASFRKVLPLQMDLLESTSAPFFLETRSCINFRFRIRLVPSGITLITVGTFLRGRGRYSDHFRPTATQYCDGLRGAIVVYDPKDPYLSMYDVDDATTVITLADWYHTPAPSAGLVPTPDSTLINGLGRALNGNATTLSVINVVKGKRYRFRVVSVSCDPNYIFSIDGHNMTIIEVDGVNHQPLQVDAIQIFAGQRYSVVVTANQPVGNYWLRAQSSAGPTDFSGGVNSAILRYQGAASAEPTTNSTISNQMAETSLVPLVSPGAPGGSGPADVSLNLDIAFANALFTVNGATFVPPTVPVLLQIISGARLATDLLPSGSVYTLPSNKTIELSIPGGAAGSPHPFHLHGHTFDVVRSAGSSVYNYVNPVRRDVVSTGVAGDNVTIRFTTNNPGPWFLHCHIDWHLELGLAIVFAENTSSVATQSVSTAWDNLCPLYNASLTA